MNTCVCLVSLENNNIIIVGFCCCWLALGFAVELFVCRFVTTVRGVGPDGTHRVYNTKVHIALLVSGVTSGCPTVEGRLCAIPHRFETHFFPYAHTQF